MVSSKLTRRRQTAKKPAICIPPPPPPPPPPAAWPPTTFPLEVEIKFTTMGGPQTRTWSGVLGPPAPPWHWLNNFPGELVYRVTFTPNPTTHLAELFIEGWDPAPGFWVLHRLAIPITWGTPHIYVITTWDVISPALDSGKAAFTF